MNFVNSWKVGDSRKIEHSFKAEEITAFAKLTGDFNPLHIDRNYAEQTPASGLVVHGMLAASFISTLIGMHIPGPGALWNSFNVEWRKMIRIGDTIVFVAEVTKIEVSAGVINLKIVGTGKDNKEIYFNSTAKVMIMKENKKKESNMESQSVLVTGASGVVGNAICRKLAKQNINIIAWGRDKERLQALQSELGVESCRFDLIDLKDTRSVNDQLVALKKTITIDCIVHAAAAPIKFVPVEDSANWDELNDHWKIDVLSFQQIAQSLVPSMPKGGGIVMILTQAVFDQPPQKLSAYVVAKTACLGLVKSYAAEWGPRGIRCNAVSPNMMNTPYTADMPIRSKQVEEATNPLRRLCKPNDVAEIVSFLLSPQSSYINGANIPVTGGSKMPL